ncbi:MAG TPA: hypothetical protein VIH37_13985 [Candidatus Limnocylindrales bacterium]
MTDPRTPSPRDDGAPRVIRNHRRFAISEVTFNGEPVGGATVDAWQNETGVDRWSARVLMAPAGVRASGVLAGRLRDGRLLHGRVALVAPGPAPHPRGPQLIEWHGVGALRLDAAAEEQ